MWQTVAVREVDEEAEHAESERLRELMFRGKSDHDDEVSVHICIFCIKCSV